MSRLPLILGVRGFLIPSPLGEGILFSRFKKLKGRRKMKKGVKLFSPLLIALVAILVVGCAAPTPSPTPKAVTDQLGREVKIEGVPKRIVSLAPSNTEILFKLGLEDKVVGVTKFCDFPPKVEELKGKGRIKVIGGFSPKTIDIEKVIALEPDLVLSTGGIQKPFIPKLEEKGLTVFALNPENLEEVIKGIELVGKVCGVEEKATEIAEDMESRIEAITDKTAKLSEEEKPRVFYITYAAPGQPVWTAGKGTFANALIEKAGGINIFRKLEGYKTVDLEKIIAKDPEVIIASTGHGEARDVPFNWAKTEERLAETSARKNGRIYQIDADIVSRPGPRIVKGLEKYAEFIHPKIFEKVAAE